MCNSFVASQNLYLGKNGPGMLLVYSNVAKSIFLCNNEKLQDIWNVTYIDANVANKTVKYS